MQGFCARTMTNQRARLRTLFTLQLFECDTTQEALFGSVMISSKKRLQMLRLTVQQLAESTVVPVSAPAGAEFPQYAALDEASLQLYILGACQEQHGGSTLSFTCGSSVICIILVFSGAESFIICCTLTIVKGERHIRIFIWDAKLRHEPSGDGISRVMKH